MASTQIANIYNPLVFDPAVDEAAIELNAFLASGVMVASPKIADMASVGGNIGEMPFHKPLDATGEPNYSSDDPTSFSTPDNITTGKMIYRLASMNKSWSTMDLARELALMDPLAAITSKIGGYWATMKEKRVIATANGIIADNVANDNSDMVNSIYDDIVTPLEGNIIGATAIIDTQQTSGDHQSVFTVIAMHSVTFSNLKKQNLIDFIPAARSEVLIPTYLGLRVVMDDSLPVVGGTNSPQYTTLLFGGGAFDYGQGRQMVPSEYERVPSSGDGGGEDIIHTRTNDIIHPYGFQFTSSSVAGQSATLAELANAANWDRVVSRKNISFAALLHNN